MPKIHFQLVTPKRVVLTEDLDSLSCPTTTGQITILPGHISLIATLSAGELVAKSSKGEEILHVAGGFVEVRKGSQVIALADEAEHFYEIDEAQAQLAKTRAEQILREKKVSSEEYAQAAATLERSLSRLRIARKHAHRRKPGLEGKGVFLK